MSTNLPPGAWIDDPDDPWVGFVVESSSCLPEGVEPDPIIVKQLPFVVRVRPEPTEAYDTHSWREAGEPIYEIYKPDSERVLGP